MSSGKGEGVSGGRVDPVGNPGEFRWKEIWEGCGTWRTDFRGNFGMTGRGGDRGICKSYFTNLLPNSKFSKYSGNSFLNKFVQAD